MIVKAHFIIIKLIMMFSHSDFFVFAMICVQGNGDCQMGPWQWIQGVAIVSAETLSLHPKLATSSCPYISLHQGKLTADWKTALYLREALKLILLILGQYLWHAYVVKFLSILFLQQYLTMQILCWETYWTVIYKVIYYFSKAFEKVSHLRLLYKLQHYGINGSLFNWIKDYLSNRVHGVVLDGASSTSSEVFSDVPQGWDSYFSCFT